MINWHFKNEKLLYGGGGASWWILWLISSIFLPPVPWWVAALQFVWGWVVTPLYPRAPGWELIVLNHRSNSTALATVLAQVTHVSPVNPQNGPCQKEGHVIPFRALHIGGYGSAGALLFSEGLWQKFLYSVVWRCESWKNDSHVATSRDLNFRTALLLEKAEQTEGKKQDLDIF